jgi:hypothetical protein
LIGIKCEEKKAYGKPNNSHPCVGNAIEKSLSFLFGASKSRPAAINYSLGFQKNL